MKKLIALLLALSLALTLSALAESEIAEDWTVEDEQNEDPWTSDDLVGAWENCDLTTAKGSDAVREMFAKAVKDVSDVEYTPVALLATQSGSGMSFCVLCHCAYKAGSDAASETGWSLVYVSQALDGQAELTNVVDIDVAALSDYGIFH